MSRATRRDMLGAGAFAALAGVATVGVARAGVAMPSRGPDAPLLALCARFLDLQAAIDASYDRERERHGALKRRRASYADLNALEEVHEAERAPLTDEQLVLLDQLGELSAATQAGQQARARVLMAWYSLGGGNEHSIALEWSRIGPLFHDLLAVRS